MRRPVRAFLCIAIVLAPAVATGQPASGCSTTHTGGGDWRSYGHDLSNTRSQPHEDQIDPVAAATLQPAWVFSSASGEGDFTGTPVVADGCVYVGSNMGWIYALNADTGAPVWKTDMHSPSGGLFAGGGVPGTLAVDGGRVFAAVSRNPAPVVAALDQATGAVLWETVVSTEEGATLYASPVTFDGMLFIGTSAPTAAGAGRIVLIDEGTGAVVKDTFTIPPELWDQGYQGAGVWATPAIDAVGKVAYVGTGDPKADSGQTPLEHTNANAILKIDLDRASPGFGEIIGSAKGDAGAIDFGASPTLFADSTGRPLVGAPQRNGSFFAFDAESLATVWAAELVPQSAVRALGDVSSPATDGTTVYASQNPGLAFGLDVDAGETRWTAATADAARYQPMSVAGGVVYTIDAKGFLAAFDAETGVQVLSAPLASAGSLPNAPVTLGAGVAIARHTVYAATGSSVGSSGSIIAFRPVI